jgi:2',5'-phosphodiesterase
VGLDLSIPVRLASADGLQTAFTNYVRGYNGALDYVWLERERMRVAREIPLPSEVEVADFLPSQRFPSDHLAVRREDLRVSLSRRQHCARDAVRCQ